jgi:hypothetical protein
MGILTKGATMTKRLTRKEVVELVQKTMIFNKDRLVITIAQDILQALETNGILCLVEGEVKADDAIAYEDYVQIVSNYENPPHSIHYQWIEEAQNNMEEGFCKIIQRNNTAVYHCEKGE